MPDSAQPMNTISAPSSNSCWCRASERRKCHTVQSVQDFEASSLRPVMQARYCLSIGAPSGRLHPYLSQYLSMSTLIRSPLAVEKNRSRRVHEPVVCIAKVAPPRRAPCLLLGLTGTRIGRHFPWARQSRGTGGVCILMCRTHEPERMTPRVRRCHGQIRYSKSLPTWR